MRPDPKDRDAVGITAVHDGVMSENELAEPGRPIFDWTSNVGKVADSTERILEHLAVGSTLAGAPLPLGVIQDVLELAPSTRGNKDLNI